MKNRIVILIFIAGVVTLSFTFTSTKKSAISTKVNLSTKVVDQSPIGGFVLEDKL